MALDSEKGNMETLTIAFCVFRFVNVRTMLGLNMASNHYFPLSFFLCFSGLLTDNMVSQTKVESSEAKATELEKKVKYTEMKPRGK